MSEIKDMIEELSDVGLLSILRSHEHIHLYGDESREELEQILRLNVEDGLIDEIEIITVLSGE